MKIASILIKPIFRLIASVASIAATTSITSIAAATLIASMAMLAGCNKISSASSVETNAHADHAEANAAGFERGPHNGRLLRDGDFAAEITIFENGVPPEFRVYVTHKGQPLNPASTALSFQLTRFAGVVDQHRFAAKDDYLVSTAEVYEPHSFDVTVIADYQGRRHRWSYASYEGRTAINAEMAKVNGIAAQPAGAGTIKEQIALYGAIQPDATRVRAVAARFPGVIRNVDVAVGAQVQVGQILARVESNESLQTYAVTAPIAGIVIQRHANAGESTDSDPLFEIADYSRVWAVLNVFPRDRARIQIGQPVAIRAADGAAIGAGTIAAISASADAPTSLNARVVLDNRTQTEKWIPGQFVNAEVTVAETAASLVLPITALQTFRDWDVVFLNAGETYQAQPVALGRRDGDNVEITSGLTAGTPVVVANSYLVKADIEKSGASHDH